MKRFLIADDHAVVRSGLRHILQDAFDRVTFSEAGDARQALDEVSKHDWDLVMLDISMPGRGGLDIIQELKTTRPRMPILVMSIHPEEQYAKRVLRAGAAGYITKDSAPEELVRAVRKVLAGGRYVSSSLAERLAFEIETGAREFPHESLSNREFQVLKLMASGKTVNQIADELSLSAQTISTYRSRILEKMGMKTNAELIHYAVRNNLVD